MLLKQPAGLSVVFSPMIVAIGSQKGGVGKTSSVILLATGLARKHKRVLLIDIDSQANSSKVLLDNYQAIPKEQTLFATILGLSRSKFVRQAAIIWTLSLPTSSSPTPTWS